MLPEDSSSKPYICKVISIFSIEKKLRFGGDPVRAAHVRWFARGENTIFGDYADPKEVFALYDCEDLELHRFMRKLQIQYIPTADNWKDQGGTSDSLVTPSNFIGAEDNIFWYRKSYQPETAR